MYCHNVSRVAGLLSAVIVATLTFAVAARAVQTIVTPNAVSFFYALVSGANSGIIRPPANQPVFVMGEQITTGNVGSSDMTVVNSVGHDNELVWNGLESAGGGVTSGFSPSFGTHMIFIDNAHCVDLRVNNATSFIVHNSCSSSFGTQEGDLTEIF
jgi:hypothetical protein